MALPNHIGKHSQGVDAALPRKHTKEIYDALDKKGAGVLAQLCTGMIRLNGYLHRIGVSGGCEGDRQAFSVSVRPMGSLASSSTATAGNKDRRHLFLPGRKIQESGAGSVTMEVEHERRSSNDPLYDRY